MSYKFTSGLKMLVKLDLPYLSRLRGVIPKVGTLLGPKKYFWGTRSPPMGVNINKLF